MATAKLVTALYFGDDAHIDSDTVFGVSRSLVVGAKDDPASPIPGLRGGALRFPPGPGGIRARAEPGRRRNTAESMLG